MTSTDITGQLAKYMVEAGRGELPAEVALAGRHRILDTLGAIISGARLKPGEMAIKYIQLQGGTPESSVLATDLKTSAVNAALANGMFGHADETDDFEPVTKSHPGCSVVPAALAMAERAGSSGEDLLRAVVLGYDLCCRFLMALEPDSVRGRPPERGRQPVQPWAASEQQRASPGWMRPACAMPFLMQPSRYQAFGVGSGTLNMWKKRSTLLAWALGTGLRQRPWPRQA